MAVPLLQGDHSIQVAMGISLCTNPLEAVPLIQFRVMKILRIQMFQIAAIHIRQSQHLSLTTIVYGCTALL